MKMSDVELSSNRKFGFFFTVVFLIIAFYFYYINSYVWFYISLTISLAFFTTTILKADFLLPLNKLWMQFGLLLGIIISPIVMGLIFFGIFTPLGILMRLLGRDELYLRVKRKKTYWINREDTVINDTFKNQF